MSTIIATTLSNGSVSVPTATVVNGSAKAWVNFNGTGTVAIRDSFNVASLTDGGVGICTVSFTSSMSDTNYSWDMGGWNNGTGNGGWNAAGSPSGSYPAGVTVNSLNCLSFNSAGSFQDQEGCCASVKGDLA